MKNSHNGYIGQDFGPAMRLRAESSGNNNGNLKKFIFFGIAAGSLAVNQLLGNPIGKRIENINAEREARYEASLVPACEVTVKDGELSKGYALAKEISGKEGSNLNEVQFELGETNKQVDKNFEWGKLWPGDKVYVSQKHAGAVEGCQPIVKLEQQFPKQ